MAAHGGTVEALPGEGVGAVLRVTLPAANQAPAAAEQPLESAIRAGAGPILVIDDEPDICRLLGETLAIDGYEVGLAASGREGLARLAQDSFDLIISDLRMPDLDGPGLSRYLRQHRPELLCRVIIVTGDVLGTDIGCAIAADGIPILEKPLDLTALRERIGRLLSIGRAT